MRLSLLSYHSGKFIYLLVSLLILLILVPLSADLAPGNLLVDLFLSVTLLASIFAVSQKRRPVIAASVLAAITFVSLWLFYFVQHEILNVIGVSSGLLFFAFTAVVIIVHIFHETAVTIDELAAAISAYLLIGLAGAFLFRLVEIAYPGSYEIYTQVTAPSTLQGGIMKNFTDYIYFSFTTLTTLGYGDIVPVSRAARVFSYLEAVLGQIYLTVLVARLVGMHISQTRY